jgi:hypothetical protein
LLLIEDERVVDRDAPLDDRREQRDAGDGVASGAAPERQALASVAAVQATLQNCPDLTLQSLLGMMNRSGAARGPRAA